MNEMCWMGIGGSEHAEKILHLKVNGEWKPYNCCQGLAVADYGVPRESKGWATCQRLLKMGWTIVPAPKANEGDTGWSEARRDDAVIAFKG